MPEKDEAAAFLANVHYRVEEGMAGIYRLLGPADVERRPDEPIKLLEVNENTVPSGIMPLRFGPRPASGIHFPSVIVEVTPDEFEEISDRRLELPHGWTVGPRIPRPAEFTR